MPFERVRIKMMKLTMMRMMIMTSTVYEVKNGDMLLLTVEKLDDDNHRNYGGDGDGENH